MTAGRRGSALSRLGECTPAMRQFEPAEAENAGDGSGSCHRDRGEARVSLMPPPARMRLLILAMGCAATASGILTGWGEPVAYAVPVLATIVALAELAVVHLSFGKQRWTFSL